MTSTQALWLVALLLVGVLVLASQGGAIMVVMLALGLFGPFVAVWLGKKVADWLRRRRG